MISRWLGALSRFSEAYCWHETGARWFGGGHAEKNAQRSIQGHHQPLPDTVVPVKNYDVETYRDGPWWMIRIPALDGLTQARFEGEVELMAREFIAVTTSVELEEVAVRIRSEA